jgi:hypothetical protein
LALIAGARPVLAGGAGLADQHRRQRVVAESITIVEVCVAQAEAEAGLREEWLQALDVLGAVR